MNDPLGLFDDNKAPANRDPLGLFEEDKPSWLNVGLPLGILETATTGVANAIAGLGAGVTGSVIGALDPNGTAKQGWDALSTAYSESPVAKVLAPQTESGKAIEHGIGSAIESFKEYANDPSQSPLKLVPFIGDRLANSEVGAAAGAAASALPELSMLMGLRGGSKTARSVQKPKEEILPAGKADEIIKQEKEAIAAEKELANRPAPTNETQQLPLFDMDQMGQQRSPYGGGKGEWRVDENGIPVRADISMEAANLEAPLQRNLFGDELGPALDQQRSLTEAIDSIEPGIQNRESGRFAAGTTRETALSTLRGGIEASPELQAAKMQADRPAIPFEEQTSFQPTNPLPTRTLGESQTLASAEILPKAERPVPQDTIQTPRSPENIEARAQQREFANRFPVRDKRLEEFDVIRTPEEALYLSKDAKDISKDYGQRQLGSGMNFQAIMTNSPALKFANTVFRDARTNAEKFSRDYITSKDTGLSSVWSKMTSNERVGVIEALFSADKHQFKLTKDVMDKLGLTERQRTFAESFYAADKALFDKGNTARTTLGLKPITERSGHFPGIFTGSYKTSVLGPDKKTLGVIATDTLWQNKAAQKYMQAKYPNAKFLEHKRASLAGTANRYYSDIFSGMNDVLGVLAKEDPRFKEIQEVVSDAIRESNSKLFNFNVHELAKKGVFGSEGNRPWLNPKRNADDAFKALVRYFEEGAMYHELQVPLKQVNDLVNNPDMVHLPNTKNVLNNYVNKVTGDDLNVIGKIGNLALDTPFKLIGVGPAIPLKVSGAIKNTMSQLFMGWGNYVFTLSQMIQPAQTGLPFMQLAAGRLGLSSVESAKSMGRGASDFMLMVTEEMTKKKMDIIPEHMREAYQYSKDRGMLEFSEMERAYQGTQSKLGRMKDKAAELNMRVGEFSTRAPMMMAFTDLLVKGGFDTKTALPIAENLTQFTMIDMHPMERPAVYSSMGVLGNFAGGLTTFKHGFASQQAKLIKEFVGINPVGKAQARPIGLSVAAMIALAGVTGLPFYGELDTAYQYLTNKFGGEQKTIRESVLENLPEWLNSGAISAVTGLNVQGKFSSADMVPDSLAKAASPHLEAFSKIIEYAIDMAKTGADAQSVRNFLLSISPAGPIKGTMENKVARDDENYLMGRDGLRAIQRTDEEWKKRAITGLRPQREAVERESVWAARQKQKADQDRLKEINKEYKRAIVNQTLSQEKAAQLEAEYDQRGGDSNTLRKSANEQLVLDMVFSEKERLEGIPKTVQGVKKYNYYNR
jgi:hypothetical protein